MAISQRMSLEEFLALPEEKPALELVDGVVVQRPFSDWIHAVLRIELARLMDDYARPRRLAVAVLGLRATYGTDSLVPDIAAYRWERVPRTPDGRVANARAEAADVVAEIDSAHQRAHDVVDKCHRYIAHGTTIALAVDPETRVVVRIGPDGVATTLRGDDRIDLDLVLPGFQLTVKELFGTLHLD